MRVSQIDRFDIDKAGVVSAIFQNGDQAKYLTQIELATVRVPTTSIRRRQRICGQPGVRNLQIGDPALERARDESNPGRLSNRMPTSAAELTLDDRGAAAVLRELRKVFQTGGRPARGPWST